jgi:short-subunit dehydrogenase
MDLDSPNAAQEIFDELQSADLEADILVNNAGYGFLGRW